MGPTGDTETREASSQNAKRNVLNRGERHDTAVQPQPHSTTALTTGGRSLTLLGAYSEAWGRGLARGYGVGRGGGGRNVFWSGGGLPLLRHAL